MASSDSNKDGAGRPPGSRGGRFLLLVLASMTMMFVDHRENHLATVRQALSVLVYPVEIVVDLPFSVYQWFTESLSDRSALLAENRNLREALLDANFRLQQFAALSVENARLRELLGSTARIDDRSLVADVLSVDLDPLRQRFVLNRGSQDGVFPGQAVLDRNGVVGQIVEVGQWTSQAVLLTDANHAIPVVVNRNGLRTIAVGTGDQGRLRLPYLTNSADVEVGDLLVSSGLGEVFPAGYPVGKVLELQPRPGQAFAEVTASPLSELDRDQEVLLVFGGDEGSRQELGPASGGAVDDPAVPELAELR